MQVLTVNVTKGVYQDVVLALQLTRCADIGGDGCVYFIVRTICSWFASNANHLLFQPWIVPKSRLPSCWGTSAGINSQAQAYSDGIYLGNRSEVCVRGGYYPVAG